MRTAFYNSVTLCIALFAIMITGNVQAQQVQIDALLDTGFFGFDDGTGVDNNFGAWTHVPVGRANNGTIRRSLFYFDVASVVPAGATITDVVFEFDVTKQGGTQGHTGADYTLHRVTTDWDEGTGTTNIGEPTLDGASWNDAKGGVPWNTPGGDFDSTSLGTVFVEAEFGATEIQINSPDLVAAVQDMLDNSGGNYGFMMKNVDESEATAGSASRVTSREGGLPVEVASIDYTLFRGFLAEGELADTFISDNIRMRFNPGFTLNSTEAPVWLIFDSNLATVDSLDLKVESQAGTPGLTATTEAWDWITNSYDVVNVSAATFNNDSIVVSPLVPGEHVEAGTAAVRSRIGWRKTGLTINFPWEVRVDQVVWVQETSAARLIIDYTTGE